MAASLMAQYELAALLNQRSRAMSQGMSLYPSMEESFLAMPGLQAGLDQALGVIELLEEYPEMAPHIPPGGVPQQQQN